MLPGICGDERLDEHGSRPPVPAAFGGFESLVLADALTIRRWYQPGMTFSQHATAMFRDLHQQFPGAEFYLHTDTHALAAQKAAPQDVHECGCAAVAKAGAVVALLIEYRDMIDSTYADKVVANAQELLEPGYCASGTAAIVDGLCKHGIKLEVLDKGHTGIMLVCNDRQGMVLDRAGLHRELARQGLPQLDPFEYDRWAMREASKKLAAHNAGLFFAGGDALNMVTINAIGHPDMVVAKIA